ncbi:MAG: NADH:ubiquinone reductase (Na(+)-transporting) subunit C [Tannerella sp.]|jgi:Na+-transporting NADH:ubiquinone oxidoreductase subunit C|nr:NADH:ubiquinone reductase (Na(+)-transporting) subunit C [Tannerella sp.]
MSKYRCKLCGYIVEGDVVPDVCPVCGAPASEFELIDAPATADGGSKKGMNRDSNVYTVVYASVMVMLVAVLLAFTSQSLRSYQKANEDNDKRQQILRSINQTVNGTETETIYKKLITDAFLVNDNGERIDGDAFAADASKMFDNKAYPVFVAKVDGQTKYVMALSGAGLWGPIWGYVSVNEDGNTIFGADFSHQGETPGLGAEIATTHFRAEFAGKQLFKNAEFKSIAVVKPGKEAHGQDYVDGISGGTITSKGVDRMIAASLQQYVGFLKKGK